MAESYSITAVLQAKVDGFVNGFRQATSTVDTFVNNNKKTFDSFKKVGAAATAGGVAVAGGLTYAVKKAADFESGMSSVAAISGATGKDLQDLTQTARDWGASTSFSATEAAEGLEYMALAGWDTQQMMGGIGPVLHLAEAGALDLGRASDLVTDSMAGLGLEVNELDGYLDKVATTAANSNTDIDALMEAFVIAGGKFKELNVPLEESTAFLGVLANRGFKASEAGTAVNAIMTRLTSTTGPAAKKLKEMGISAYDSEGNFRGMEVVLEDVRKKMDKMTDAERANASEKLAGLNHGKTFTAMLSGLGDEYHELKGKIKDSEGALLEMRNTMKDNLQGELENLSSAFEEIAISIGTALLPLVKGLAAFVQSLADKFNNLDEKTKTLIAIVAALSAGFLLLVGPILMIIGFIPSILAGLTALSTVGTTIIGVLTGTAAATGGAGAAFLALAGPIALVVAAIAAIGIGTVALVNHLSQDAIPEVQRFGEGVSEATQEAVGAFMDMSEKADVALKEIVWSQQEMTAEMATNMIEGQQEITDTLLTAIGERHTAEKEQAREQLQAMEGLSDEQKNSIIEKINERYEEERITVEEGSAQIEEIYNRAANNNRRINEEESNEILAIRQSMTDQAVVVMSESEAEQKLIYEKMKDNATTISALEATEVVQNSVKKKEDVVKEAGDQFDETYKWAIRQRDELGTMSAEEADAVIKEAEKKRDESVDAAEEMHAKVVEEAKLQAKEHVEQVNWETGEILSKWEVFKNDTSKKWNEIRSNASKIWEQMKVDLIKKATQIVTDASLKWDEFKQNTSQKYEEVKKEMRKKMDEAVEKVLEIVGKLPGKAAEKATEMVTAGKDLLDGLIKGILSKGEDAINAIVGVVDGVISKAKSLLKIESPSRVFMEIGSDTVEGFEVGVKGRKKHAEKQVTKLFDSVLKISKDGYKAELDNINKNNSEMSKVEKRASEDINLIKKKALDGKRELTQAELIRIRRLEEDAAKKARDLQSKNNKIELDMAKNQNDELLKASKEYVDEKRKNGEMSLSDEIYFWNAMYRNAEEGSEQYEFAMDNHQDAVKKLRQEVENANKESNDRILAINEEYNRESKKLLEEHEKDYDAHLGKLLGFAGAFDTFERKMDLSGQDFIEGMQSQVDALIDYDAVINSLGQRIDDKALMDELKDMGVKALGELEALNKLSDIELQQYADLYRTKFEIAKNNTDNEMQPMMEEVDRKLIELKKDSSKRLDEVNEEWQLKIKQIVKGADKEFDSMLQVGIDAMQGLSSGMASMRGALVSQAESIANSVKQAMASAFDIHSPSRWMRDMIGKNMMLGWMDGMEAMKANVVAMAVNATGWMTPDVPVLSGINVPSFPQPQYQGKPVGSSEGKSNGSNTGGDLIQHIAIHSPKFTSPSDNARLIKQQSRDLLTEWRR